MLQNNRWNFWRTSTDFGNNKAPRWSIWTSSELDTSGSSACSSLQQPPSCASSSQLSQHGVYFSLCWKSCVMPLSCLKIQLTPHLVCTFFHNRKCDSYMSLTTCIDVQHWAVAIAKPGYQNYSKNSGWFYRRKDFKPWFSNDTPQVLQGEPLPSLDIQLPATMNFCPLTKNLWSEFYTFLYITKHPAVRPYI